MMKNISKIVINQWNSKSWLLIILTDYIGKDKIWLHNIILFINLSIDSITNQEKCLNNIFIEKHTTRLKHIK